MLHGLHFRGTTTETEDGHRRLIFLFWQTANDSRAVGKTIRELVCSWFGGYRLRHLTSPTIDELFFTLTVGSHLFSETARTARMRTITFQPAFDDNFSKALGIWLFLFRRVKRIDKRFK